MTEAILAKRIENYLQQLCIKIANRHVGSPGNRAATDFFARTIESFGFQTDCPEFDCIDWEHGEVSLTASEQHFKTLVGPYSPPCQLKAALVSVATMKALAAAEITGKIVLLHGELAKEQLMPKNFPFYNPEEHRQIIRILEEKSPAAIVAATERNPTTAGGVYPFPLIEDGDFDIPSVYMKDTEGKRLLQFDGAEIELAFESRRIPSTGCNVIARKGRDFSARLVLCAHIDAKKGTPGALDNATGVVVLLALAELLRDYSGKLGVEIVAFNGEDYYAASGQIQYLNQNQHQLDTILMAINIDGAGYYKARTAYSFYDLPVKLESAFENIFVKQNFIKGEPWYQGDHSIFIQNQRPAIAITSENLWELSTHITHNPKDRPELVTCEELVKIAVSLQDIVNFLGRM